MKLVKKSYLIILPLIAFLILFTGILMGENGVADAAGGETKLYKAAFSYTSYLCTNTTETMHSSGNGVTECTCDSSQYGTSAVSFDIYGASYKGDGILNGGYLNSSSVHVVANTGWSTSSVKLKNSSGEVLSSGTVALSAVLSDGTYTVIYEGTGQGWLVNGREYSHYRIVCEFTFGVDTEKPSVDGISSSLSYVNKDTIITPSDSLSGVSALYMRNPSSSSFTAVSWPYTLLKESQNGKYTFYSEDAAGNVSEYSYVFLDTEKPSIKIKKNGYEVSDLYIAGDLGVSVTDNGETDKIYISENGGDYKEFDGTYSENVTLKFKATDKAGNVSEEKQVFVDTVKPFGRITDSSGTEITSLYFKKNSGIKYMPEDSASGIKKKMVKMPGSSSFTTYNGFVLFNEGKYEFYSEDNAGNRSDTVSVTVDFTRPVVKMFEGETEKSVRYSKASSVKFLAEDSNGIESVILLFNGYEQEYTPLSKLTEEGSYTFYALDKAGNQSDWIMVTLDRTAPSADVFAGGLYTDHGISNKENFFVSVYDTCSNIKSIIYSKDGNEYENYVNGSAVFDEGDYIFIAEDNAGNEMEPLRFTLDRTPPEVIVYDETDNVVSKYASSNIIFSSMDENGILNTKIKSQSDLEYRNYVLFEELEDGEYYFFAEDIAGNKTYVNAVVKDTVKPLLQLYSGETLLKDVNFVNNTIRVYASDKNTKSVYVILPGESQYVSYNEGNILSAEGTYSFKAVDAALNESDILTITIDKTGPSVTLFSENNETDSGSFVNTKIRAESSDISGSSMFVKIPGSIIYSSYTGELLSGDGTYYFYATDGVSNSSKEVMVTVDTVSPEGKILREGVYANTLYSNAAYLTYESSDALSGTYKDFLTFNGETREYKGEMLSSEGHYIFKTLDKAGNESLSHEIYLDRTKPSGLVNSGGKERTNKPFSFTCEDETALKDVYIMYPFMDYQPYLPGSIITDLTDGWYRFYCTDMAGNISDTYSLIVDVTNPLGVIIKDNKEYKESYVNGAFYYVSERDATMYVKTPGDSEFKSYKGEIISEDFLNGEYYFYAEDRAGNVSAVSSIILDTVSPIQYIYSDGYEISVPYTNKNITYFSEDENGIEKMHVFFNGNHAEYDGSEINGEGEYEFYSVDAAGNESERVKITIDKTKPEIKIYNSFNEEAAEYINSERIYMSAEDDNLSASYLKRPSDSVYGPYTPMSQYSEEGRYYFYSVDKAGNISDIKTVTVDRTADFAEIMGVKDGIAEGSFRVSFKNNGISPVESLTVNGVTVESGEEITCMDEGNYRVTLEDKAGNKGTLTLKGTQKIFEKTFIPEWYETSDYSFASFEKALEYAGGDKDKVRAVKYFEKTPAGIFPGENLYKSSYTLSSFRLISGLLYIVDGEEFKGLNYSEEGRHEILVSDRFSNTRKYDVLILSSKDKILLENEEINEAEYYLSSPYKISINSMDEDALLIVKNEAGETLRIIKNNEEYFPSESYVYLTPVNRYGTGKSASVYLSLNPAEVLIETAEDSKKLFISYVKSEDKYTRTKSFKIYKEEEAGNFTELLKDDYRKEIGSQGDTYSFRTSGKYIAVYEDNFRYKDNSVTAEFEFYKAPPELKITDVSRYYVNEDVYVSYDDEAFITLKKDGKEIPFAGGKIKDEGVYELVFEDYDLYSARYCFEIDKTAPSYTLSGCSLNSVTNDNVKIMSTEENVKLSVMKNNEVQDINFGDSVTMPGIYKFEVSDLAGNVAEGMFEIDKKVDFVISTLNGGISSDDVVIEGKEDVKIYLKKGSEDVAVSSGDRISDEGFYKGEIEDAAGNREGVSFLIQKSKVKSFSLDLKESIHVVSAYKNEASFSSDGPFVFNEDGRYTVTLSDGERTASFVIIIDTTAPTAELEGVMNGGKTNKNVKVKSVSEECTLRGYLNGRPISFSVGSVFEDEGVYTLYFEDSAGNESTLGFEIKKGADLIVVFLVILMVIILIILGLFLVKSRKKKGPDSSLTLKRENPEEDTEKKDIKEETKEDGKEREKSDGLTTVREGEISEDEKDEINSRDSILRRLSEGNEKDLDSDLKAERDLLFLDENMSEMDKLIIKENSFAEDFSDGFINKGLIKGGDGNGGF